METRVSESLTLPIPHSRPTLSERELDAVKGVLTSGQWAAGPQVEAFEARFAQYLGLPEAVAVSSGSAGLHLALRALEVGKGDEVLMPSYVCAALLHAVLAVGAVPVLVDSQPDHAHMDSRQAMRKISPKTKAVILVHLFGDVLPVHEWRGTGIRIIEDATQSLGNTMGGRKVGSLGDLSVFSFYATKVLATGEGGMIGVRDIALAERLRDERGYDQKDSFRPRFNYKMTDIAAALGLVQLEKLPSFVEARRKLAMQYDEVLDKQGWRCANQDQSTFYRYVVSCNEQREEWARRLNDKGIHAKRPVHQPNHVALGLSGAQFPHASSQWTQNLSIPLYPSLKASEIRHILKAIASLRHVDVF